VKVAAQKAEMRIFTCVPEPLKFFVYETLRLARVYTSLDDLEHYQTTRLNRPLRRALRELGARLVSRGVCHESMDIFFARRSQLENAIQADNAEGWQALCASIRAQKAAYKADAERKPEWNLGEDPVDVADGAEIAGLPGSPGSAEGLVYVVNSPDDFARFPRDAVLVARTTNPAWTPLFYSACAVVTESGGPLSHGAVTAREMRIPAVMSVRGCLSRLENGQRVRVDGTRGQVFIL
jgi:pyruvate,water dikinase